MASRRVDGIPHHERSRLARKARHVLSVVARVHQPLEVRRRSLQLSEKLDDRATAVANR
jgi:hypothetical protein